MNFKGSDFQKQECREGIQLGSSMSSSLKANTGCAQETQLFQRIDTWLAVERDEV